MNYLPTNTANTDKTSKRITLETELASWTDQQALELGLTTSQFVSALLEWARDEDFVNDDALFTRPAVNSYVPNGTGTGFRALRSRARDCPIAA